MKREADETPEMEAEEHSKGFLKKAAQMRSAHRGGRKKGKRPSHKRISK